MSEINYQKGSIWRKWDFHVHTKGTNKNDQFKSKTFEEFCLVFFKEALENKIAAIGITDYFCIDNYIEVIKYIEEINTKVNDDGELLFSEMEQKKIKDLFIFPNVELRMLPSTDKARLINIHCIFNPDYVEFLDNDFFSSIENESKFKMNKQGMREYGLSINSKLNPIQAEKLGLQNFAISPKTLKDLIDSNKKFKENSIIVVSNSNKDGNSSYQKHYDLFEKEDSALDGIRKSIYKLSDGIFSANKKDEKYFLGKSKDNKKEVINKTGSLKPCLVGSDAHKEEDLFNRWTWIKANPNFNGLKQLLVEPERAFIGEEPELLKRVKNNKSKFVKSLSINKIDTNIQDIWFEDFNIEFNSSMIAIIGNKGNGKSAITDVISLCGNTHQDSENFSFLEPKKFKKRKPFNLAEKFEATLIWEDGISITKNLNDIPDKLSPERIKYIPQNFLEKLCSSVETENFETELKKIIFSHTPRELRLGKDSLDDLIDYKSEIVNKRIASLQIDLSSLNIGIIDLENKSLEDYKKTIENKLKLKNEELDGHKKIKPIKPKNSAESKEEQGDEDSIIEKIKTKIQKLKEEIQENENELINQNLKKEELENAKAYYNDLKLNLNKKIKQGNEQFETLNKYGIDIIEVFTFKIDDSKIVDELTKVDKKLNAIEEILNSDGHPKKINELELQLQSELLKLEEPAKLQEQYLKELEDWKIKESQILGDNSIEETLKYFQAQLKYWCESKNQDTFLIEK